MGTYDYTQLRGEGAEKPENKPIRYLLKLDILDEEKAVYGDRNGPAVMIMRSEYDSQNRPQAVTLILGEEVDPTS
jgi:hypothetical protein